MRARKLSGRDWLRSSLIVGQVALGLVLTAGAGLLVTSFLHLRHTDVGFDPDHLLTLFFETPDVHYRQTRPQFYRPVLRPEYGRFPACSRPAASMILPMTDDGAVVSFEDPNIPFPKASRQPPTWLP